MTKTIDVLDVITNSAKSYRTKCLESIKRNSHMNNFSGADIKQYDIDAILVDFINYVGFLNGVDCGLYTDDIQKDNKQMQRPQQPGS